jgi:crotonobetainyl-CoA:carnitine CoA-transferase CaiB-like acyl-CoA transferase
MVVEVEHATLGPVRTIGLPVKFSDTPGEVARGAPLYGQHTCEVLREHGFADDEIDNLLVEGAIVDRWPTAAPPASSSPAPHRPDP